ncbi:MAG TPA: BadF/BadG/BcrA/BcrD ATPase family protein [Methylomirabilota bacterium]|nr:BadF/BadG/BcrA/BcrD ATPase family protein [Methylomirabilota bacterium]
MPANRHDMAVAVGVDLGGTWMRLHATAGPRRLATWRRTAPPPARMIDALRAVWNQRGWRRRDVAALVIASRGVWTAGERRALARRLAPLARRVLALSDAEAAALGALSGRPGVLLLAGTGSIAIGHDALGRWRRAGGLGPLLGDEGSAFWIGHEWIRATVDDGAPPARRIARTPDAIARIAARAPAVLRAARAGDRRARAIVREAQRHLARLAASVVRELALPAPVTVTWAGGLLADAWFRAGVRRALTRTGPPARWRTPRAPAVVAAARLAAQLAAGARPPAAPPGTARRA